MKKLLLITSIIGISLLFIGCDKHNNSKNNQFGGCIDNGGNPESRFNGSGKFDVCYFEDESFCFLEELENGNCKKGDHFYDDEEYYTEAFEEFNEELDEEHDDTIENKNDIKENIEE